VPIRIALLGIGLVGGSIAGAVRRVGWQVAAWTPSGVGPRKALQAGAIDVAAGSAGEAIAGADLVVLAAPASACLDLLDELGGPSRAALGPASVVTDVASTKVLLVARAAALGLPFVGGHPMAGRETSGFGAADPGLFQGRPWVIVPPAMEPPPAAAAAVALVEALATACGARPVRMSAADHDAAVAAISHAPLVVAAALVEAAAGGPAEPERPDGRSPRSSPQAAGGSDPPGPWRPDDGSGDRRTNAAPLAASLRDVRDRLDEWIALLETAGVDGLPDEVRLRDRLAAARARLESAR